MYVLYIALYVSPRALQPQASAESLHGDGPGETLFHFLYYTGNVGIITWRVL